MSSEDGLEAHYFFVFLNHHLTEEAFMLGRTSYAVMDRQRGDASFLSSAQGYRPL